MRLTLLLPLVVLVLPQALDAQKPPGRLPTAKRGTPTTPTLSLPIEVVKGIPVHSRQVYYERNGLKPKEFRIGQDPQMTGAVWQSFKEGPTQTKVVNGRSVITGTIEFTLPIGATCADQSGWLTAYIQFRTTDINGTVFVSNIKGDRTCYPLES